MSSVRSKVSRLLLLLCLAVWNADGAQSQEIVRILSGENESVSSDTAMILIEETIRFHRKNVDMSRLCRSTAEAYGCTDFPLELLECECVPVSGGWRIVGHAHLRALIHLSDPRTLIHERQHLSDIRDSLAEHLETAGSSIYPDERICRTKARVMSSPSYLRDVMNAIRVESNRKYRCQIRPAIR